MILQIERKDRRTYIDGVFSPDVHHKSVEIDMSDKKVDRSGIRMCPYDINVGMKGKIRIISYLSEDNKKLFTVWTNCTFYLLNDNGKTISRYGQNTLN